MLGRGSAHLGHGARRALRRSFRGRSAALLVLLCILVDLSALTPPLAVLIKICTSGRSCPPAYATHAMFVKKEPERAASSWTVNEAALTSLGTQRGRPLCPTCGTCLPARRAGAQRIRASAARSWPALVCCFEVLRARAWPRCPNDLWFLHALPPPRHHESRYPRGLRRAVPRGGARPRRARAEASDSPAPSQAPRWPSPRAALPSPA